MPVTLEIRAIRNRLLAAFRTRPPASLADFRAAAKQAGCPTKTARRAFERGWGTALPPLKHVLAEEAVAARALLRQQTIAERLEQAHQAAKEDAVEARANEGKAVRAVQLSAMNSLLALHAEQIHVYQRELAIAMKDPDPASPKTVAARRAFREIADIITKLVTANEAGQRMERLLLEAPTTILGGEVGIRPVVSPNITPDELANEIEAAKRAEAELRELNESSVEVVDGTIAA